MECKDIKYIHIVLQASPPSISSFLHLPPSTPRSPSPWQPRSYFSMSMNLTTLSTSYKWTHSTFVLLWLAISLSMSLRFFCVVACVRVSFLFEAEWYSIASEYTTLRLFIRLLMETWVASTFCLLWIMLLCTWGTNTSLRPCF